MNIAYPGKQVKIETAIRNVPLVDTVQQIDTSVSNVLDVAGTEGQVQVPVTFVPRKDGQEWIVISVPDKHQSEEKIREFEGAVKIESFLYQKVMLELFKKNYPEYEHKELIFVGAGDPLNSSKMLDAVFYDTFDETYTTIQYQYACEATYENYVSGNFAAKYNDQILHIMDIATGGQQDFDMIYDHIKTQECKFDIVIQSESPSDEFVMAPVDSQTLTNIYKLDHEYMTEEGNKARNIFYHAYHYKNKSYFIYDQKFIMEFYQFLKGYNTPSQKWVGIDNQKGKK